MLLALDSRLRRARAGFTLLELIIAVIIIALLAGLGLMGYSTITANTKRTQARELLSSVAAAQQSWYRSKGSFVAFATPNQNTATTSPTGAQHTFSGRTDQLLRRIAPGTADAHAAYVDASTASDDFGKISVGVGATNNWQLLALTTQAKTGECFGQVSAPTGSGLAGFGPDAPTSTAAHPLTACSASALLTWYLGNQPGAGTSTGKPGAPTNFTLTPAPGRVILTWNAPASDGTNDPVSYVIAYTDAARTPVATIDASVTSYADGVATPLDPTKQYGYQILARNAAGDSPVVTSTPATVAPLDPAAAAPPKPTGLTGSWDYGQVHLKWNAATSGSSTTAVGYQIQRDGTTIACLGDATVCTDPAVTRSPLSVEYLDNTASLGAAYSYTLRTLNAAGSSGWTALSFTTPPPAPTGVGATALPGIGAAACPAPACAQVSWTAPPAATGGATPAPLLGYRVYRCADPSCDPAAGTGGAQLVGSLAAADGTSFVDRSLTGASTYYYKVVAFNANTAASTNASAAASVTTVAAGPSVTGTAPAPGQIVLTWSAPAAPGPISGYNVYRLDDNGNPVLLGSTAGTTYTDTGADLPGGSLDGFTTYTYRVAASTAAGLGMPSADTAVLSAAAPIRGVTVSATTTTATLTWKRSAGVSYTITRGSQTWTTTLGHFTDTGLTPGTGYSYTLAGTATDATTGQTSTATSAPIAVTTVPGAPGSPTANPTGTTVVLGWAAPAPGSQVDSYRVYRCAGNACTPSVQVAQVPGSSLTWTDSNLAVNSFFTYAVTAVTSGGQGAPSSTLTTATVPSPVTATATGTPKAVNLSWTADAVATGYDVYRNGAWLTGVPAGVTSFSDGSIVGGVVYTYVIRAKDAAGTADSAPVSAASAPDPPTGLSASPGATSVTLTWLAQGADGYQLLRCAGQNCDPSTGTVVATLTPGSTTSYVDTGLAAQSWYTYAIRAGRQYVINGTPTMTWSATSAAVAVKTVLDPPGALTVGAVTSTTVPLSWTGSAGAANYRIYRNGAAVATISSTGTSYTDTALTPGTRYSYAVSAVAPNGEESGLSAAVSATTTLDTPTNLAVTATATTSLTLSWTAVTGATSYEVDGCVVPCSTQQAYGTTANGTTTSLTITGLSANTEYTITVKARSADTTSASSAPADAWTRPNAPAAPTVTGSTPTTVGLSWPSVANALSYTVLRDGTAVGTVTAPTTGFTDGKNMLPADFASGGESTGTGSGTTTSGGIVATSVTSPTHSGTRAYSLAVPANLGNYASIVGTTLTGVLTPGTSYTWSTWLSQPSGAGAVQAQIAIAWKRLDGSTISYATVAAAPTSSTWTQYKVTGTAPAGTASAYAYVQAITSSVPVPAATTIYADDQQFEAGTVATAFAPGGLAAGSTHAYSLTVTNKGGASAASATTNATLTPAAPAPSVTGGYRKATISWPQVPGATSYQVYRCAGSGCDPTTGTQVGTVTEPTRSLTDSTLADNTTYGYAVRAVDSAGTGPFSPAVSTLTTPAQAGAPTFSGIGAQTITVSWAAVSGASTYQLFRAGALVYTGSGTSYTDTGLNPGQSYSYAVASGNATGYSPVGPAASASTLPAAVTNLTVTGVTSTTLAVSWTPPPGTITGYQLSVGGTVVASTGAVTSYTFTGLTANTGYTLGVAAVTSGGTGTTTTVTGTTAPAAPLNLSATPGPGLGAVSLSWNAVPGATSYKVLRGGAAASAACTALAGTSCTDTGLDNATSYSYVVVATGPGGDSDQSTAVTVTTLAAAPTSLVATASGVSVTLTWTAPAGTVAGYKIYRCAGTSCTTADTGATSSSTSYTDTSSALVPGGVYTYQVSALTAGGGESAQSAAVSVATVPTAPTGLAAAGGNGKVTLTWSTQANVNSFTVYRCTGSGCTPTTSVGTTTVAGYTDTTVAGGTTYTYTVVASNGAGASAASAGSAALTTPSAPTGATASVTPTSATLSWANPGGTVTGYKVYRGGTLLTTIGSAATTSYTDSGLSPNTAYSYTVSAYNATGEGTAAAVSATTTVAVPTGLAVTGVADTTVSLSWTATPGASAYKVYTNGANPVTVSGGSTTSYTVTGLAPGTTFSFTLTALGTGFESAPSTAASATTTIGPPSGLTAAGGLQKVTLTWTPVPGAAGYYVYRCTGACTPTTANKVGTVASGSTGTFTDTGLTDGTTYSYAVATYTASFTSGLGATVSATTIPPAPTGLAGSTTDTTATLSWTAAPGASSYKVYNGSTVLYSGSATTVTLTGLSPASSYSYAVSAVNAAGESAQSAFPTQLTRPAAPTLTVTVGYRQLTATWTASAGATSYRLLGCTGASCAPATVLYTGTATSYTWTGLADNTVYGLSIGASNASGETRGATVYATTTPATPTGVSAGAGTETATSLSWTASAGAASYQLTRDGTLVATVPGSATSWTDMTPNLLSNFGFEQPLSTYAGISGYYSAPLTQDTTVSHSGSASLRVDTNRSDVVQGVIDYPSVLANNVVPAGTTVNGSLWFKGPAGVGFAVGGRAQTSSGTNLAEGMGGFSFTATGSWQLLTLSPWTYSQDAVPGIQVRTTTAATGITFWVDDASVSANNLRNLLTPDVASGTDASGGTSAFLAGAGVSLTSVSKYDFNADSTKRSLEALVPATSTYVNVVAVRVPVTAGTSYQLTQWARLAAAGDPDATTQGVSVYPQLLWENASNAQVVDPGTGVANVDGSTVALSSAHYSKLTTPAAVAPAGATQVELRLNLNGVAAPLTSAAAVFTDGWWLTAGLHPNTQHSYTLAAGTSAGVYSPASATVVASTRPLPVAEVALNVTSTGATATWAPHPDGTSYQVFTCTAASGSTCTLSYASPTSTTTSTSYAFTGLASGSQMCVAVAVVSSATGLASDPAPTAECHITAPAAPTGVTVTGISTTGWTVSWTAPPAYPAALSYEVQVTDGAGTKTIECSMTTATSCVSTGHTAGTNFTVAVHAVSTYGTSDWSTPVSFATVPTVPTLSGSMSGVTASLSWNSAGPNASYTVYRDGTAIASGLGATSYTGAQPARGTTYSFTVQAFNSSSVGGGTSNAVSLTTAPPNPGTAPSVSATANHQMQVSVTALSAATSYAICRATGTGACTWMATLTGGTLTWTDPGPFTGGVTYTYEYYGTNAAGSTAYSPGTAVKASYDTAVYGDNPALYYRMNENPAYATYNPVADASGNGHNGTVLGNPVPGPNLARGSLGSLDMSGQTGGTNPIPLTMNTTGAVTVEATITFPKTVPTSGSMAVNLGSTSLYMPPAGSFGFNAGYGTVYGMTATQVSSTLLGGTHHIVAVFQNGANMSTAGNGNQLYVDGVAQTMSVVVSYNTTLAVGSSVAIGNSGSGTYEWDGAIDNVAVYNGAMTAATVTNHYNATDQGAAIKASTPLAFWPLNDPPLADSSGNNHPAGFIRSPKVGAATGPLGFGTVGGVNFNGWNGAPTNLPVSTTAGASTTVDMIVQFPSTATSSFPFHFAGGYTLWLDTAGHFGFNTGHSDLYGISSSGLLGGVHRITAVFYNGAYTGNNQLYVDGAAQTLSQLVGSASSGTVSNTATIGSSSGVMPQVSYSYRWGGAIADVAIYNGALSAAQVSAHQSGGASGDNATALLADSPIAFYRLNDFSAADASGNNRPGTYDPASGATYGAAGALSNSADPGITMAQTASNGTDTADPGLSYSGAGLNTGGADRTLEFWAKEPSPKQNTVFASQGLSASGTANALWLGNTSAAYWNSPFYVEDGNWAAAADWGLVGPSNTRSTSSGTTWPTNTFPDAGAHVVWDHPYTSTELIGWQVFRRVFTLNSTVTATVYATADDRPNVWVDGTQVISAPNTTSSYNQTLSASVTLGPGPHVIMVGAVNAAPSAMTSGAAGLALSLMNGTSVVTDAVDGSPIHTDATWHAFTNGKSAKAWTDLGYWDDVANVWYKSFWEPVTDEATSTASPWVATTNVTSTGTSTGAKWGETNAHWIWAGSTSSTSSVAAGDVYFRKKITVSSAGNFGFYFTADDSMDLYVDGTLQDSKTSAWQKYDAVTVTLSAGDHEIAVKAHNTSGGAGVLMSIRQSSGGSQVFQSDSSWVDSNYQSAAPANSYSTDIPANSAPVNSLTLSNGSTGTVAMSAPHLTDGGWHLLDLVVTGGTTVNLYTDGVLTDTKTMPAFTTASGQPLMLNGILGAGTTYTGAPAGMDEFAMYNTALSSAQVSAHYAAAH